MFNITSLSSNCLGPKKEVKKDVTFIFLLFSIHLLRTIISSYTEVFFPNVVSFSSQPCRNADGWPTIGQPSANHRPTIGTAGRLVYVYPIQRCWLQDIPKRRKRRNNNYDDRSNGERRTNLGFVGRRRAAPCQVKHVSFKLAPWLTTDERNSKIAALDCTYLYSYTYL